LRFLGSAFQLPSLSFFDNLTEGVSVGVFGLSVVQSV
jgi:hypothetical protein